MRGTPKIPRTERLGSRDRSSLATRYASGEAPREGDVVFPVGDCSGLLRCHYWVLGVSRFKWTSTTVNVQPILEPGADRERDAIVDACVDRFRLIQRGGEIMKEFWALRQPDGEFWTIAEKHGGERHIATFATQDEAVEYSECTPALDYAVAVKFVQVAR